MADSSTKTIEAFFTTRSKADLAIEHLVQQHRIPRADIFVDSSSDDNSAGSEASGGDVSGDGAERQDAALNGDIRVSVDVASDKVDAAWKTFEDAGGTAISVA